MKIIYRQCKTFFASNNFLHDYLRFKVCKSFYTNTKKSAVLSKQKNVQSNDFSRIQTLLSIIVKLNVNFSKNIKMKYKFKD